MHPRHVYLTDATDKDPTSLQIYNRVHKQQPNCTIRYSFFFFRLSMDLRDDGSCLKTDKTVVFTFKIKQGICLVTCMSVFL